MNFLTGSFLLTKFIDNDKPKIIGDWLKQLQYFALCIENIAQLWTNPFIKWVKLIQALNHLIWIGSTFLSFYLCVKKNLNKRLLTKKIKLLVSFI